MVGERVPAGVSVTAVGCPGRTGGVGGSHGSGNRVVSGGVPPGMEGTAATLAAVIFDRRAISTVDNEAIS